MAVENYTLKDAAEELGVSYWTLRRILVGASIQVGYKFGGDWLIPARNMKALRKYLKVRPKRGRPPKEKKE